MIFKGAQDEPVQVVTSAAPSLRDDQAARVTAYLWQMLVRIVCFVLGVASFLVWHTPWIGWVLLGAAAVLPNTAVIVANATSRRRIDTVDGITMPNPPHSGLHHPQIGQRPR